VVTSLGSGRLSKQQRAFKVEYSQTPKMFYIVVKHLCEVGQKAMSFKTLYLKQAKRLLQLYQGSYRRITVEGIEFLPEAASGHIEGGRVEQIG
jgi:hypothetical protein